MLFRRKIKGVKFGLGRFNLFFHGQVFQEGLEGAEPKRPPPVYHGLSQPQGNAGYPVFMIHSGDGIIVIRLGYPGKMGIKHITVPMPHHLLDNHRHLFLFDDVIQSLDIPPGIHQKYRCINQSDGVAELLQPVFQIFLTVGNHIGLIDSGKGLGLGILQKTG